MIRGRAGNNIKTRRKQGEMWMSCSTRWRCYHIGKHSCCSLVYKYCLVGFFYYLVLLNNWIDNIRLHCFLHLHISVLSSPYCVFFSWLPCCCLLSLVFVCTIQKNARSHIPCVLLSPDSCMMPLFDRLYSWCRAALTPCQRKNSYWRKLISQRKEISNNLHLKPALL